MKIATYNILANAYLRPNRYPLVAPALFDWEQRKLALLARILGFAADIVCLQEIEPGAFEFLESALRGRGYAGVYAQKRGRPDGCATFLRQPPFAEVEHTALYYRDQPEPGAPSGHLALIVSLRDAGRSLRIANTHLRWASPALPNEQHIGYRQVSELLAAVVAPAPAASWILCGDWNATPESPIVGLALAHGLVDAGGDAPYPTINATGPARRIDYLFHTPDLAIALDPQPPIGDHTVLPAPDEPSDHLPVVGDLRWRRRTAVWRRGGVPHNGRIRSRRRTI